MTVPGWINSGGENLPKAKTTPASNWMTTPAFWEMYWFLLQFICAALLATLTLAVFLVPVALFVGAIQR